MGDVIDMASVRRLALQAIADDPKGAYAIGDLRHPDFPQREVVGMLGGRMLTRGDIATLAGEPKVGKTWLALKLADAIAHGTDFAGMPTTCGRVLFISEEMTRDQICKRVRGMHGGSSYDAITLRFGQEINIGTWQGAGTIKRLIAEADSPELVIIDNFRDVYFGRENDNDAVSAVLKTIRKIAREFDVCILFLDHFGKPGEFRTGGAHSIRGASVKFAMPATIITAERDKDRRWLKFENREGEPVEPVEFSFHMRADGKLDILFGDEA